MARQPLIPEALARLAERLAPGGRPLSTRRLRGGVSSRMDVIQIERANGTRFALSLRRSAPVAGDHAFLTPEQMAREYAVLQIVEAAGLPAPRPLLLDAGGELFGVPAMAVSYLPGRPFFAHDNAAAWTDALARAIYEVHTVTPDCFDLTGLGLRGTDWARGKITRLHEWSQSDPLAAVVHGVLEAKLDDITLLPPTLVHGDFWTGNTIAYRGRVTGLVDWGGASLGDPRIDVAGCRLDFVLTHGADLVDAFRQAYERLAGAPLPQLWFFDLLRGLEPLLECEHWLEGYVDFGLHVPLADAEGRLRAFLTRALEESGR